MQKPFLKWAGNKYSQLAHILPYLPNHKVNRFFEPFVGSGAVYLNYPLTTFSYLNDSNVHLISVWNAVLQNRVQFEEQLKNFFGGHQNDEESYYRVRSQFNKDTSEIKKSNAIRMVKPSLL